MEQNEQHVLNIENLKKLTASGIASVDSFSPTLLNLSYQGGRISVGGSNIKIDSFSKTTGALSATGEFRTVKYSDKGETLRKKLFK